MGKPRRKKTKPVRVASRAKPVALAAPERLTLGAVPARSPTARPVQPADPDDNVVWVDTASHEVWQYDDHGTGELIHYAQFWPAVPAVQRQRRVYEKG
jgi:hypothetical protein